MTMQSQFTATPIVTLLFEWTIGLKIKVFNLYSIFFSQPNSFQRVLHSKMLCTLRHPLSHQQRFFIF